MTAEAPPRATDPAAPRYIAVIAGGLSYEREVSLSSGQRVADALRRMGYETAIYDAEPRLLPALLADRPDAVMLALHGSCGEDGALRGLLDLQGIPYLGAGAASARLAWDKPTAKEIARRAGVPTPDWIALPQQLFASLGARQTGEIVVAGLGLPLIVKPARGGSGLGVRAVQTADALATALVDCFGFGDTALIEQLVDGVDVAVSIVGDTTLPPVEIQPQHGSYDYTARYTAGGSTWHVPARFSDTVLTDVARHARLVHDSIGLRDLSRMDFMIRPDGTPLFLEASVAPGMTETSLLPLALRATDRELGETLAELITAAIAHNSAPALSAAMPGR